jgi:hypothetical protein
MVILCDAKCADVKPIESKPFTVNAAQKWRRLKTRAFFNYFGTNAGILLAKQLPCGMDA